MQPSIYVGLSAQIALRNRLDTIAHNVANSTTAGFRAEHVRFDTLVEKAGQDLVAFASAGETYLSRLSGGLTKTDNPLDVAVSGESFFAFRGPNGPVYSRDGRMIMTPQGQLVTLRGYPILDVGGAELLLDPNAGPPAISRDGMITQNGLQVGAIGLFSIDPKAKLTRFENSGVIPDRPAVPTLDFVRNGVAQGFVENSNVNAVEEMSRLIAVQRAFESVTSSLATTESSFLDAVKTLGATS